MTTMYLTYGDLQIDANTRKLSIYVGMTVVGSPQPVLSGGISVEFDGEPTPPAILLAARTAALGIVNQELATQGAPPIPAGSVITFRGPT